MTTPGDDYDRGHVAGGIDARLAGHDQHFSKINGSIERMVTEMHALTMAVQRLGDMADSDRRTVVTTAAALKDAEEARRSTTTDRWGPWQKAAVLIGAAGTIVGIVVVVLANT